MLAVGGMPGHWRNTTAVHRKVLYTIAIILSLLFGMVLFRTWDYLEQNHDMGKAVEEGYQW